MKRKTQNSEEMYINVIQHKWDFIQAGDGTSGFTASGPGSDATFYHLGACVDVGTQV